MSSMFQAKRVVGAAGGGEPEVDSSLLEVRQTKKVAIGLRYDAVPDGTKNKKVVREASSSFPGFQARKFDKQRCVITGELADPKTNVPTIIGLAAIRSIELA